MRHIGDESPSQLVSRWSVSAMSLKALERSASSPVARTSPTRAPRSPDAMAFAAPVEHDHGPSDTSCEDHAGDHGENRQYQHAPSDTGSERTAK